MSQSDFPTPTHLSILPSGTLGDSSSAQGMCVSTATYIYPASEISSSHSSSVPKLVFRLAHQSWLLHAYIDCRSAAAAVPAAQHNYTVTTMSPSRLLSSNFCTSRRGTLSDTSLDAHDNDGFVAKVETAHPHPKSYAYSNSHDPDGPVDHGSPRRKSSNALSFLRVSFSSALLPREKANVRRKQRSSSNTSMMPNPFSRLRPHRRSRENHVSSKSILHPKHVVRPAQPPHPPSHPPDQRLNPGPEAKGEDKDRQEESARRKSETQFTDLPPSYRDWGRAQRSRKRPPAHPSHIPLFRSASPPSPKASSQLILAVHPDPRPNPPRRLSLDTLSIISYGAAAGSILEVGEPLTDSEEDARPPLRPVEAESVPILVPMSDSESETESSDESDYSSDKGGPVEKPFPGDLGDGRSKYERIEARWRRSVSGMGWRHSIQSKSCLLGAVCVSVYNPLDDLNRRSQASLSFPSSYCH
jgi:hypothetical protein